MGPLGKSSQKSSSLPCQVAQRNNPSPSQLQRSDSVASLTNEAAYSMEDLHSKGLDLIKAIEKNIDKANVQATAKRFKELRKVFQFLIIHRKQTVETYTEKVAMLAKQTREAAS